MGVPAADAEDIAQEALIKACTREKPLPECSEERKALLLAIVKFQVLTYISEKKRALNRAQHARVGATVIGLGYAQDKTAVVEAREQLELVFSNIPPQMLEVYIEKVLDELTLPEVAEALGLNVNTAQSYWHRALSRLEAEIEKLDKPNRGRLRGFLIFGCVSGILGGARNASAMVNWLIRLFRSVFRMGNVPIRVLSGVATSAALVMYSPAPTNASVDELAIAEKHAMVDPGQPPALPSAESRIETPAISTTEPKSRPFASVPREKRNSAPQRSPAHVDGLLSLAKAALEHGDARRVIALLDQLPPLDRKSNDVVIVSNLRAAAERAVAKSP